MVKGLCVAEHADEPFRSLRTSTRLSLPSHVFCGLLVAEFWILTRSKTRNVTYLLRASTLSSFLWRPAMVSGIEFSYYDGVIHIIRSCQRPGSAIMISECELCWLSFCFLGRAFAAAPWLFIRREVTPSSSCESIPRSTRGL